MPRLLVDRLHCIGDSPEWTADEVYLLVVQGRMGARGELRVLTLAAADWRGLHAGSERRADVIIDAAWSPDKIYVGLLLEQDGKRDLARDQAQAQLQQELAEVLHMFASIRGTIRADVAEQLRFEVDRCVERVRGNDEPIGAATLLELPAGSSSASFGFRSGPAHYRLELKVS